MQTSLKNRLLDVAGWLLIAGWLLLPYTHLRWLPNLGTTRPISALPFALAAGLAYLARAPWQGLRLRQPRTWLNILQPFRLLPEWRFLRWWLVLIALGSLSALITPFYGNFFQALNRLFGYTIIFVFFYAALVSLRRHGLEKIATWAHAGYLPALVYAVIEIAATRGVPWANTIVIFMRQQVIVEYPWVIRMALFATEPSFLGFQALLLIALFPFLRSRLLRLSSAILIGLILVFSVSGTVLGLVGIYALVWVALRLPRRILVRGILAAVALLLILVVVYAASPRLQSQAEALVGPALENGRVYNLFASSAIRSSFTRNLIYTIVETRGLGLGIGQYGMFWKDIYLRHIDYKAIDVRGEITAKLNSSEYMRPWSVLLGLGTDLGLIGMAIFLVFYYQILRCFQSNHARAVGAASFVALLGAYPIVTPHIWLALAVLAGQVEEKQATKAIDDD
ncbi:MAG: hypothetical protein JW726_00210 [Anaerolineales bacterium]|nr:hypothetical protein [Anaerolineales bacterium]